MQSTCFSCLPCHIFPPFKIGLYKVLLLSFSCLPAACYILPCLTNRLIRPTEDRPAHRPFYLTHTPPPFPFSFSQPIQQSHSIYHHCSTKRDLFILFSLSESKEYHCLLAVCRTRSFASLINCGGVLGLGFAAVSANSAVSRQQRSSSICNCPLGFNILNYHERHCIRSRSHINA